MAGPAGPAIAASRRQVTEGTLPYRSHDHTRGTPTVWGVSASFTADRLGHPDSQVPYMGYEVTVETPRPPDLPKADPPVTARTKRAYRYPEWRRKRGRKD